MRTLPHAKKARARFLPPLYEHLNHAGLGHVSEICDAEPPHTPRGCPFQAWSLGELLRLERACCLGAHQPLFLAAFCKYFAAPRQIMSMADKTRVLILGGGFGGLYAALQFEKRRDPRFEVTVVNRENFFLFTPMLHEIAASDLDLTNIVNPVRKMIRHVNFFCGDVDKIDIDKKQVVVSHGFDRHSHTLEYDHLVLALGR